MSQNQANANFAATPDNHSKHYVAIDLGSNSFHMIVAREQGGCLQIVHRQKQQVRLGAGLSDDNLLSQSAIENALDCLKEFKHSIENLADISVRIVATYALRKAKNSDEFLEQAKKVIPYPIDIISGKMEAELIYNGVAHTQPIRGKTLIIDIGGGSTEFVIGNKFFPQLADSLDMGCISYYQQFFKTGIISADIMKAAQQDAEQKLQAIADKYRKCSWKMALGTSGSIKVISQIMLELYGDEKISAKRLKRLVKQLILWGHSNNLPLHCIEEQRRPLIAGAVAVLSACFKQLNIQHMAFSQGGVREGVLYQLSDSRTDIDTRERTINNLVKLHHIDQRFSQSVQAQIHTFIEQLNNTAIALTPDEVTLLMWSAQLHEIGISINAKKRHRHGAYIIEHSDMPGFSETEQRTIAAMVSHHRAKIKFKFKAENYSISNNRLKLLIQILRLAILFTQGRVQTKPTPTSIKLHDMSLAIATSEQQQLNKKLINEVQMQQDAGLSLTLYQMK